MTTKSPEIDERVYPIERFYNHTPIHLIGCKLPLDRRTKGARGAATASPHSMVQEFLNRSDDHLWAFLSNGLQLRILRDNISLSRQAFVEFDLEAMMEGEVYADFALLWLLCHQSRVEADKAGRLLAGEVEPARPRAGHAGAERPAGWRRRKPSKPSAAASSAIRATTSSARSSAPGRSTKDDFYRQLLRIVYRLLFLFVAEDRELLHPPDADREKRCDLYDTHYSTRRLRELALQDSRLEARRPLAFAFARVRCPRSERRLPAAGLCGLGSFLWRAVQHGRPAWPAQSVAEGRVTATTRFSSPTTICSQAIRALAYVEQDRVLRIVDYRNLGSEELGSVYESLLELHPVMNVEAKAFELSTAAGNERKTTGCYYTPDSLVQCLLDSALDPVVEDRLKGKKGEEAEQAILDLKVCDPACG